MCNSSFISKYDLLNILGNLSKDSKYKVSKCLDSYLNCRLSFDGTLGDFLKFSNIFNSKVPNIKKSFRLSISDGSIYSSDIFMYNKICENFNCAQGKSIKIHGSYLAVSGIWISDLEDSFVNYHKVDCNKVYTLVDFDKVRLNTNYIDSFTDMANALKDSFIYKKTLVELLNYHLILVYGVTVNKDCTSYNGKLIDKCISQLDIKLNKVDWSVVSSLSRKYHNKVNTNCLNNFLHDCVDIGLLGGI